MTSARLQAAVSAVAAVLFCTLTVAILGGGMAGFDEAVRTWVHGLAAPWLTTTAATVTWLGTSGVLAVLGVIEVGILVRMGRRGDAPFVPLVMAGALVLENALKFSIQRPRPPPFFGTDPTTYSFPSGHALFSLCFYGASAIIFGRTGALRAIIWAFVVLLVAAIGGARVYLGVHYPSDVLGGYLVAIAWLFAVQAVTSSAGTGPARR